MPSPAPRRRRENQWHDDVERELERQADRAKELSKWVFRLVPVSLVVGVAALVTIIEFWSWREAARMLLQVILTITLGATVFAGVLRRLESKLKR